MSECEMSEAHSDEERENCYFLSNKSSNEFPFCKPEEITVNLIAFMPLLCWDEFLCFNLIFTDD